MDSLWILYGTLAFPFGPYIFVHEAFCPKWSRHRAFLESYDRCAWKCFVLEVYDSSKSGTLVQHGEKDKSWCHAFHLHDSWSPLMFHFQLMISNETTSDLMLTLLAWSNPSAASSSFQWASTWGQCSPFGFWYCPHLAFIWVDSEIALIRPFSKLD